MKFKALIVYIIMTLWVSNLCAFSTFSTSEFSSKESYTIEGSFDRQIISDVSNATIQKNLIPLYVFCGICLVAFILTTAFAFYFKQAQFVYYSLYILLIFIFLSYKPFGIDTYLFGTHQLAIVWFEQTLKVVFNIVYVLFCLYFIDVKRDYTSIFRLLMAIIYAEIIFIILNSYVLYQEYYVLNEYFVHFHHLFFVIIPGLFCIVYVAIKSKNNLTYFVVVGATFYVLPFYPQYYMEFDNTLGQTFKIYNYFFILGFTIEIIIYTFGLSYKVLTDYKEKLRFQQESFTNKTKALRAQINPHFIFNSLSSIQHLVTSNDKVATLKYLSKFSRLTRNILESSIETNVILSDEIKMLKDYLELESLRFDNSFNYTIDVAHEVDSNSIELPFLISQPFVENAIIHGLLPKKEGKKDLEINFNIEGAFLLVEIDDTGVGRELAEHREHIHKKEIKSRGLEVTKQRLEAINASNKIEIIDKRDTNGNALGTCVRIKIPL